MTDLQETRSRIAAVNVRSDINDVRILRLDARAGHEDVLAGPYMVATSVEVNGHRRDNEIRTLARYELRADHVEAHEEATEPSVDDDGLAWQVTIEIMATFAIAEDAVDYEFSDEELSDFALSTGIMAIHPYAREAVQSTVGRLGYPPFTMELMRSAWYGAHEQEPSTSVR